MLSAESEMRFEATPEDEGRRLDLFLTACLPPYSRSQLRRWIEEGRVEVGGRPAKPHHRLRRGEMVAVRVPAAKEISPPPRPLPLKIVYEDNEILLVDKPAGRLVHPFRRGQDDTLVNALRFHTPRLSSRGGPERLGLVHRLDRDTSGLLIVAKTDAVHEELSRQFKERTVEKEYRALVLGRPPHPQGEIDYPIGRSRRRRLKMTIDYSGGRQASTSYGILESFPEASFLRLIPKTGRTHQIRLHLARLGCPVLGDREYGRRTRELSRQLGITRQMLHAYGLKFRHPTRGEILKFSAPLPEDMETALKALRVQ